VTGRVQKKIDEGKRKQRNKKPRIPGHLSFKNSANCRQGHSSGEEGPGPKKEHRGK